MNSRLILQTLATLTLAVVTAHARDLRDAGEGSKVASDAIVPASGPSPWRIGASYAPFLGLKTTFSGLGTFNSPFTAQPTGGGRDYDYDDGFVHVDISNNAGGQTWNWGYDSNSQYNPAGNGSMAFSLTNSQANAKAEEKGGGEAGFELSAYRDMGTVNWAGLGDRKASWGFRGGIQYAKVDVGNGDTVGSGILTTIDTFNFPPNVVPPGAPYSGSFNGPGPLIGDSPTRNQVVGGTAVVSGWRDLDVDLFVANFGSYLELPVTDKFDVLIEGGVNFAVASGSYDFLSNTSITNLGTQQSSGSTSSTLGLPGVYLGLSGIYELNDKWAIQGSGRYQYMRSFDLSTNGSEASLSFDTAFVVSLGVLYSF